jgi:hypothetical protein
MEIGEYVIIGGLFVQLFVFGFFVVSSAIFHRRMNKAPTPKSQDPMIRWRQYLTTLYVTSALIWIRSVFRAIEYIEGNKGYLMTTEAFLFVFDSVLIFICMVWMNWFHPSEIKMLLRGEIPIRNGMELMKRGGSDIPIVASDRERPRRGRFLTDEQASGKTAWLISCV